MPIEMKQTHQWIQCPRNRMGGYLFKCIQCGYHDLQFDGRDVREAYRLFLGRLKSHACMASDKSILGQFEIAYGKRLKDMIL
ncbi:MAG: hypothetical protein OXI24_12215 [Candidatus Poribacteria bacterium]|nr:hypothetical protein [Candidatus Poribacteria bacterium]